MRKFILGGILAAILLPGLCLPAKAAENIGSIHVNLQIEREPVTSGTVTLYRVGEKIPEGYRIADTFGGGLVKEEDSLSPHLAQWLAQTEGDMGRTRRLDDSGNVTFSKLSEGLYLLIQNENQEDQFPVLPFLLPIPFEGQWDVYTYPQTQQILTGTPPTGQHPAPLLGAMGMVLSGIGLAICVDKVRKK